MCRRSAKRTKVSFMSSPKSVLLLAFCLCLSFAATAQPASVSPAAKPTVDNAFVQKQFGSTCSLIGFEPLIADLDGDRVEDIVIPARCITPMMDQMEDSLVVVDSHDSYLGAGSPKISPQFSSDDAERRGYSLLVIHGAGAEACHSATPKAKFLIV